MIRKVFFFENRLIMERSHSDKRFTTSATMNQSVLIVPINLIFYVPARISVIFVFNLPSKQSLDNIMSSQNVFKFEILNIIPKNPMKSISIQAFRIFRRL